MGEASVFSACDIIATKESEGIKEAVRADCENYYVHIDSFTETEIRLKESMLAGSKFKYVSHLTPQNNRQPNIEHDLDFLEAFCLKGMCSKIPAELRRGMFAPESCDIRNLGGIVELYSADYLGIPMRDPRMIEIYSCSKTYVAVVTSTSVLKRIIPGLSEIFVFGFSVND
jgi:hypothetical protein